MRSLHVITSDERRGAQTFAVLLAKNLSERGHHAEVVALQASGTAESLDVPALAARRRSLQGLSTLRRMARDVEVVVAHGSSTLEACALALAGTPTPFVYRTIGDPRYWRSDPIRQRWVHLLLRRARRHVVLWEAAREALVDRAGIPTDAIDIIPNAVDETIFLPARESEREGLRHELWGDDRPCVVYVGAMSDEKNPSEVLELAAQNRDVRFVMIGTGPREEELRRSVRERSLDNLLLLGQRADITSFYQAADLLLLPSLTEGMPGVVLEAGLCGLPSLATPVGAVPSMLDDGRDGFIRELPWARDPEHSLDLSTILIEGRRIRQATAGNFRGRYALSAVTEDWLGCLSLASMTSD